MKIDRNKLEEQRREATLKSGKYVLYEMIVPKAELSGKITIPTPIINLRVKHCNPLEIGVLLGSLKESYKMISKQYPEAIFFEKIFFTDDNISSEMINESTEGLIDIDESED